MDFRHYLTELFCPGSVAIIGASERSDSVGTRIWSHIVSSNPKVKVFPVNPKYKVLNELPCYPSLKELPEPAELAVVTTPPSTYPKVIEACLSHNVKSLLLCGGYSKNLITPEIEKKIQEASEKLLILGPQSLGFVRPSLNLNASFMPRLPRAGNIGIISQSPGLSNAIAEYVTAANGGFSCIIDPGLEEFLEIADLINFLSWDRQTECIGLYLETFKNPRKLLTAIAVAAKQKPVLILKGGRSRSSADIVLKNNSKKQDSNGIMDKALLKAGAMLVETLSQFNEAIQAFMYRRTLMKGDLFAIANSKGVDTLLADHSSYADLQLAMPSAEVCKEITSEFELPYPFFNPLNVGLSFPPEKLGALVEHILGLEDCAAILLAMVPNEIQAPMKVAEVLLPIAKKSPKMLITVWLGGEESTEAIRFLHKNGLPAFDNIPAGTEAIAFMKEFSSFNQKREFLYKDPAPTPLSFFAPAAQIVQKARDEGRNLLYEEETKRLLASIGFNTAACMFASSPGEAIQAANALGYPVAMKIRVDGVLSKSDLGGVIVGINNGKELVSAWNAMKIRAERNLIEGASFSVVIEKALNRIDARELRMGIRSTQDYGPMIFLGVGGFYGEIIATESSSFVPVSYRDAEKMISSEEFSKLFDAYKGLPKIDKHYLCTLLIKLSELAEAVPALKNLEIDPLLCSVRNSVVLDAHASLGTPRKFSDFYGSALLFPGTLNSDSKLIEGNFGALILREAQHADHRMYREYWSSLSEKTKRLRFHGSSHLPETAVMDAVAYHKDRSFTVFAVDKHEAVPKIRGEATFSLLPNDRDAEFGVSVADEWQGKGLSKFLMGAIEEEARRRGIRTLIGYVLKDNLGMDAMMTKRGYAAEPDGEDPHINLYCLILSPEPAKTE